VYEWIDNWADIPFTERGQTNGRTHGVETTNDGHVVIFRQADPSAVLVFDDKGELRNSWGNNFTGAHGLTLVQENGMEFLWLTDELSAAVVKTTLDGDITMELDTPPLRVYDDGEFVPTWVAVNEERNGGNGDIWVADGYGEDYIHRYAADGTYRDSINGDAGNAGRFECPHGIWFDTRGTEPELYVADRGNQQVQVYAPTGPTNGRLRNARCQAPVLSRATAITSSYPELLARVAVLDADDKLVGYLGENADVCERDDWPNVSTDVLAAGQFNSPHDVAVDDDGNIYIVEWITGGRITKLERIE